MRSQPLPTAGQLPCGPPRIEPKLCKAESEDKREARSALLALAAARGGLWGLGCF
jgi:hypothetical protein